MAKTPDCIWAWEYITSDEVVIRSWKPEKPCRSNPSKYVRADLIPTWQPIEMDPTYFQIAKDRIEEA